MKEWWRKQEEIRKNGELEERQEFTAYLMWQTWKARNRWLYNSEKWAEVKIIQKAWNEWMVFKCEQTKQAAGTRRPIMVETREHWQPPELDTMRLNVSSNIAVDAKDFGLGIIPRNGWGLLK